MSDLASTGPASPVLALRSLNIQRDVLCSSSNVLCFLQGRFGEIGSDCGQPPLELIIKVLTKAQRREEAIQSSGNPISQGLRA